MTPSEPGIAFPARCLHPAVCAKYCMGCSLNDWPLDFPHFGEVCTKSTMLEAHVFLLFHDALGKSD